MSKTQTYCEYHEYKAGDRFNFSGVDGRICDIVEYYSNGTVVVLARDNGTNSPLFVVEEFYDPSTDYSNVNEIRNKYSDFISWYCVKKVENEQD